MRAQVHRDQVPQREGGQEARVAHAFAAQRAKNAGPGIARGRRINQDAHLDAAAGGLAQRPRKRQPRFIAVEYVGAERDRLAGLPDGLEHRREGFLAVEQRLDSIAREQRPLDHSAHHPRQQVEVAGVAGQVAVQLLRRAGGLRLVGVVAFEAAPQQDGLAADAIDSQDEVERRPGQRHQPDEANPRNSRARVPLVEDRVPGGHQRQQHVQANQRDFPDVMGEVP